MQRLHRHEHQNVLDWDTHRPGATLRPPQKRARFRREREYRFGCREREASSCVVAEDFPSFSGRNRVGGTHVPGTLRRLPQVPEPCHCVLRVTSSLFLTAFNELAPGHARPLHFALSRLLRVPTSAQGSRLTYGPEVPCLQRPGRDIYDRMLSTPNLPCLCVHEPTACALQSLLALSWRRGGYQGRCASGCVEEWREERGRESERRWGCGRRGCIRTGRRR